MSKNNIKFSLMETKSLIQEKMISLNDHMTSILIMMMIIVTYWIINTLYNKKINFKESESNETELFWTSIPMLILIYMALPSIMILYSCEESLKPFLNIKIKGLQWWWEYETPLKSTNIKTEMFLKNSNYNRILSTSSNLLIPLNINSRLLITSQDVIHSWAIPSLFIKTDAIPGRINQASLIINKPSIMKGQCSEICGMNHSFMPISVISK